MVEQAVRSTAAALVAVGTASVLRAMVSLGGAAGEASAAAVVGMCVVGVVGVVMVGMSASHDFSRYGFDITNY